MLLTLSGTIKKKERKSREKFTWTISSSLRKKKKKERLKKKCYFDNCKIWKHKIMLKTKHIEKVQFYSSISIFVPAK